MKLTLTPSSIRISLITTALGSSAFAADNFWNGSVDSNWNETANWDLDRLPSKAVDFDNAIINTLVGFPVITADLDEVPNDIKLGLGSGNSGRVDHLAGLVSAGAGNWSVFGESGGSGIYNLADTAASGGTLTGFGTGSGDYSTERLYVARDGGATGELAVNTSGTVTVFNDMYVGQGGTGVVKWDAGTLNRTGGWMVVGLGGTSGNGTFNISGGTFNASNDSILGLNPGATGFLNQTGGTYNAGGIQIGREGGTGTWTVAGASTQLNSSGEIYIGWQSGSDGTLQISGGTVDFNNWVNVGRDGGTGSLEMTGGALNVDNALRIGWGAGGVGNLEISGGAQITAGIMNNKIVIGENTGDGTATVSGAGTVLSSAGEFHVGNDENSAGQLTVDGGTASSASWFSIGRDGAGGSLVIEGGGVVNQGISDPGSRLELTSNSKPSTASITINGGTLTTNGITNGGGGTTNVFLNDALLKPRINNDNFLEGLTAVTVEAGGVEIDTDGRTISIYQPMVGLAIDGGLTKSGSGLLRLNRSNTYSGTTTVSGGILGGTGSVTGSLLVQSGTVIAPGEGIGTFGAGDTTIAGSYSCEIDGTNNDVLDVTGTLNLDSATDSLDILLPGTGATLPVYLIARYTSLSGTFASVSGLPPGYSVDYLYNGGTRIAITRPLTPYESWTEAFFPGETDPAVIGADADPDGDGQANRLEFVLGGAPDDGGDNARIHHLTEDSGDAGTARELLMTIAVRDGGDGPGLNPVFAPATGGNPTAIQDGVTIGIEGGTDLTFAGTVSVVNTVATGLPAAPAGYEYRSFSLDGSDGLPTKGFMRVLAAP